MRTRDVDKLPIGVYLVHWRDDTASLAAVGMTQQGSRWLAPVNWTRPSTDRRVWRLVRRLSKAAVPPAPCIGHDPVCPCQDGDSCHYVDTETTRAMKTNWIDRFAKMDLFDAVQTIQEDWSTLSALIHEAETVRNTQARQVLEELSVFIDNRYASGNERSLHEDEIAVELWVADRLAAFRVPGAVPDCADDVCQAAKHDGVLCAEDECDFHSGVRKPPPSPEGAAPPPAPREAVRVLAGLRAAAATACEACEAGMRLSESSLHYHDGPGYKGSQSGDTWGVCRKVVAALRAEGE